MLVLVLGYALGYNTMAMTEIIYPKNVGALAAMNFI